MIEGRKAIKDHLRACTHFFSFRRRHSSDHDSNEKDVRHVCSLSRKKKLRLVALGDRITYGDISDLMAW